MSDGDTRDARGYERSDYCISLMRVRPSDHRLFRQDKALRVRVDQGADAVYINLSDADVAESEEIKDGIVVDYDAQGRIVGVEILDASKRTGNPKALKDFSP